MHVYTLSHSHNVSYDSLSPSPPQTVLVYGFDAEFAGVSRPQWRPPSIEGLGTWFGITAFLFCVHSMVRKQAITVNWNL